MGHKSLHKNAFKSQIFLSSDLWPALYFATNPDTPQSTVQLFKKCGAQIDCLCNAAGHTHAFLAHVEHHPTPPMQGGGGRLQTL
jgi:hypothetical protein